MKPFKPRSERRFGWGRVLFRSKLDAVNAQLPAQRTDVDRTAPPHPTGNAASPLAFKRRTYNGAWVETFLIGFALPSFMLWLGAQGSWAPYTLPLLYLAPLVLGLRYGFAAGTGSAVLAGISLALVMGFKPDAAFAIPRIEVIGLLLVGMVAGQASEVWAGRMRRLGSLAHYHQTRLEQFTSAYHLLKVSHAQLEQRVAGGACNLRNALEALQQHAPLRNARGGEPLGGIAQELLTIMVEQGDLYTAAVYAVNESSLLKLPALAKVGDAPDVSVFNSMLRESMRTGMLTSAQKDGETGFERVIAVVPLVDSTGHIHGVVVIHDMPFLAVNLDTFGLLGVLGRHIGDILTRLTRPIDETDSMGSLRDSLQRHLVGARQHGVPSTLLACRIADTAQREMLVAHCGRSGRGLDQTWLAHDRQGHPVVFKLLPLTDETGAMTMANRLRREKLGGQLAATRMTIHIWMLDQYGHCDELLIEVCRACDIERLDAEGAMDTLAPTLEAES